MQLKLANRRITDLVLQTLQWILEIITMRIHCRVDLNLIFNILLLLRFCLGNTCY